jgi:tetratricopeptide (TPR) repeat protein
MLLASAKEYFARAIQANARALDPHMHMEAVLTRSFTGQADHDRDINREIIQFNTELLEIDPFIPFARKNLAGAYYNLGQFEPAFAELRKVIDYEPNYVPAHLQLAEWYSEHGDAAAGEQHRATAVNIVNKHRNFKPTQPYEGALLGRPEESWAALTGPKR